MFTTLSRRVSVQWDAVGMFLSAMVLVCCMALWVLVEPDGFWAGVVWLLHVESICIYIGLIAWRGREGSER